MKQNGGTLHPIGNAIFSLYKIEPSTCSRLERKLKEAPGIAEVNVNYAADIVQIQFDPTKVTSDDIRTIMKKLEHPTILSH
jgi:copper chaperone CopZ